MRGAILTTEAAIARDNGGEGQEAEMRNPIGTGWRKVVVWFCINGCLATIIFLLLLPGKSATQSAGGFFVQNFLQFQVISFSCLGPAYWLQWRLRPRPFWQMCLLTLPVTLLLAAAALMLVLAIFYEQTGALLSAQTLHYAPVTLSITAFITVISCYIESLAEGKKTGTQTSHTFSLKTPEGHLILSFPDINYVRADGAASVIHTNDREHRVPLSLKQLAEKLPGYDFMRIHKSYVANLKSIVRMEYDKGGSYIAYLRDEDDSAVPVGRKYAQSVKKRLLVRS